MKRMHVTVARLRDVKVHAIRINGHLHVTGMTLHDSLVVPTRTFWSALASCTGIDEPNFGDEYAFFRKCTQVAKDCRLYFTVTVHADKAALLTDVEDSTRLSCQCGTRRDLGFFHEQPRVLPWPETSMPQRFVEDHQDDNPDHLEADQFDPNQWPLLAACEPESSSHRLWGWASTQLPQGEFTQLLSGPEGTLRPSRN